MKKFYTLLAAAAVVMSASAFDKSHSVELANQKFSKSIDVYQADSKVQAIDGKHEVIEKRMLSARKADSNPTIEGLWDFIIGDYYMDYSTRGNLIVTFNAVIEGSNVVFIDETNNYFPMIAGYSVNTGLLWFGNEVLVDDPAQGIKLTQQGFQFIEDKGSVNKQVTAHYVAEEGMIMMDERDTGIGIVLSYKENGIEKDETIDMFDLNGAERSDVWTSLGTGTFVENISYPFFSGKENTAPVQVEVLKSETTPGLYKIKNPLLATYQYLKNTGTSPSMYLDASDPENVLVIQQTAGVIANVGSPINPQITGYLLYFSDSWYYEEAGSFFNESGVQYLTMNVNEENGVTTINFPGSSCVLFAPALETAYNCPYPSTLRFYTNGGNYDAVEGIIAEGDDVSTEYFNLQGIKVAHPEAGQLLIKRRGSKSEKVIY